MLQQRKVGSGVGKSYSTTWKLMNVKAPRHTTNKKKKRKNMKSYIWNICGYNEREFFKINERHQTTLEPSSSENIKKTDINKTAYNIKLQEIKDKEKSLKRNRRKKHFIYSQIEIRISVGFLSEIMKVESRVKYLKFWK